MFVKTISKQWTEAGLKRGDIVLIHSSMKRTLSKFKNENEKISPQIILESFIDAVGPEGTLLFPLFNFEFTKGKTFDIRNTQSHMGALTEAARLYPNAVRTGNPIYSFAGIGAKSEFFRDINNFSGYGSDSPFGILRELDGKIAVLDLSDQNSMTFYHHIEEMNGVPYRYHKKFTSKYIDKDGITTSRTYGLYVRDLDKGVLTHVNPMGDLLWKNGLYHGDMPKENSGLRIISARALYDFVLEIIKSGKAQGLLYKIEAKNGE